MASTFNFGKTLVETQALHYAQAYTQTLKTSWALYHDAVIQPLASLEEVTISPNYQSLRGAIPTPATYLLDLSERLQMDVEADLPQFLLYSDHPFPLREQSQETPDAFQKRALAHLMEHPAEQFSDWEVVDDRRTLNYAEPLVMEASCVACHNLQPDSPKQDWQVGMVGGILTVRQPLTRMNHQIHKGIQNVGIVAGLLAGVGILGGMVVKLDDDLARQRLRDEVRQKTVALERLDLTDALTHIANRRQCFEALDKEWRRVWRQHGHLSLLLCDIDHFADYNELYGTQAGDECLQAIAQTIEYQLKRAGDVVARIGDDEFCVILPETSAAEAEEVAAIVMDAIHNLKIVHAKSDVSPYISLSIGIASTTPSKSNQPEDLIKLAEQVLHKNVKQQGRNDFAVRLL
ncbi:MAG: diguanylate cyclase [Leptolyngbyaceae cyanobacterium]